MMTPSSTAAFSSARSVAWMVPKCARLLSDARPSASADAIQPSRREGRLGRPQMVQDPALGRALKESASGIVLVPWPWGLRDRARAAGRCPSCPTRHRKLDSPDVFVPANFGHVGGAAAGPEMSRDGVAECVVVDTRRGYRRHGLGGTTRPVTRQKGTSTARLIGGPVDDPGIAVRG